MFEHVAELLSPVTQQAGKWLGESWEEIPAFVAFFLACFLAALVFWSRVVRLPLEKASLLSSCTMSLVHALVVDIVGYQLLQDWKTFDLDMPNTPKQTRMLQFSLGYMIADFGYLMLFTPTDLLFIVHHTISSFYIVGCLKHGHSAISCILMFWMGEITSPLLNAFTFSRELRHVSKAAQKVFALVSPLFTAVYILVRSIVAPPLVVWFVYSLWFRASAIPLAWRAPMGACVTLGIVGSQVWTAKLVKGFMRQRKKAKAV